MNIHTAKTIGLFAGLVFSAGITRADAIHDWNSIMQATVAAQAPFPQARFAAITQLAVFEAVNAVTRKYKPYLGTIAAAPGASAEAAAIAAAHAVLKNYFPASAATLLAARTSSLATIPDGPAKASGIIVGELAAAAMIADRMNDGSATPMFYMPTSSGPGEWQTTPSCPAAGGVFFHWRNVKTFGLRSADQFRLDEPPALSSAKYARDYNEVKAVGSMNSTLRPKDRSDVALFYAVTSPVAVWNPLARQLSIAAGSSPSETARALALLNMAMHDAAVATFDTKYEYNLWRPETAIRMAQTDNNGATDPDASFTPLVSTPCFPAYPSAHATLSNAAREVLERLHTPRPRSLVLSNPAVPGVTLGYGKLKEVTADIDDARVYGGIHFRFDQEAGGDMGRRIGEYLHKNMLGHDHTCGCEDR